MGEEQPTQTARRMQAAAPVRAWYRRWWVVLSAVLVVMLTVGAAVALGTGRPSGLTATDQPLPVASPTGAVVQVGAVDGPAGQALLWLRLQGKVDSDLQWLQYSDAASMVDAFATSPTQAMVVSESTKLPKGVSAIGTVFSVDKGESIGTQVLVARTADIDNAELRELLAALRSSELLSYLNGLTGVKVSRA